MGVLSDSKIKEAIKKGYLKITDFDESRLGPNSYNLRLGNKLLVYENVELDMKKENKTRELIIPEEGIVLYPGMLYLGETMEWTECGPYLPMMEGRSSIGRLGIDCIVSAGAGDIGFKGNWTLEIRVIHPVRVYAGVEFCQLLFFTIDGKVDTKYHGKYLNSNGVKASKIQKDFEPGKGYHDLEDKSSLSDIVNKCKEEMPKFVAKQTCGIYDSLRITPPSEYFKSDQMPLMSDKFLKDSCKEGVTLNINNIGAKPVIKATEQTIDFRKLNNFILPHMRDILCKEFIDGGEYRYLEKSGVYIDMINLLEILDVEISQRLNAPYLEKSTYLIELDKDSQNIKSLEVNHIDKTINIIREYRDKYKDIKQSYGEEDTTVLILKK